MSDQLIPTLQAALAPVTVISGAALLLSAMTLRYGRTSDRFRNCLREYDQSSIEIRKGITLEVKLLYRRLHLIRVQIACVTSALLLIALTIFFLFYELSTDREWFETAAKFSFISSLMLLTVAMVFFLGDIIQSLQALRVNLAMRPELEKIVRKTK
jgi:hypothetical protein